MVYNCAQRAMNTSVNNNYLATPAVTSFRGNVTQPIPQDTVELSTQPKQKKKRSVGKKILIGLGITASAVVVAALAYAKHQAVKLDKLYNEKLVKKLVDKEIVFTEAATKEEAIKYAKDVIGVQKIDENMTLEVLNYANKGITDVMNKNVGKEIFVPRSYFYDKIEGELAHVVQDIESKRFGELGINKQYFDNDFLTERLDKLYGLRNSASKTGNTATNKSGEVKAGLHYSYGLDADLFKLYERYCENPNNLTIAEKRSLAYSTGIGKQIYAENNHNWTNFLERNKDKIKLDMSLDEFKNLTNDEKQKTISKYLKDKGISITEDISLPADDGLSTIYHEMGHLQDFAKNLKELDLKQWRLPSFKNIWKEVEEAKAKGENVKVEALDEVNNRWSGTTYGDMGKLFKEKPEKFKKLYPDLYEHLTNKEIKKTTEKVSCYAQTSIGEFVAETYAKMIKGDPIPEDVLKLYKKYNGSLPNGF